MLLQISVIHEKHAAQEDCCGPGLYSRWAKPGRPRSWNALHLQRTSATPNYSSRSTRSPRNKRRAGAAASPSLRLIADGARRHVHAGEDDASPEALAKKRIADAEALIPAIEQALESVKTKNVDDYKLRFILAQAHHDCGRDAEAAQALSMSSLADKPGVVATRAELLNKAGKKNEAVALLRSVQVQRAMTPRIAAQRLKFDDIDGCKEAIAIYPGNEPEDIAKKAVLAAFYDADEAEELVNQLPQDLVPQVDEEMTQDDVDKLLEAGVPPRASRRENLNLVVQAGAEELAEARRRNGRRFEAAEEAREAYLAKLRARASTTPRTRSRPTRSGSRTRSYNKRGRKNKGKFTGAQGNGISSKDAQKLDAKSRADERKAKDEKAEAERDAAIAAGLSGKKKRTGNRKRRGNGERLYYAPRERACGGWGCARARRRRARLRGPHCTRRAGV